MDRFEHRIDARELGKKSRKIDKLERINGLGAANRSTISFQQMV